MSERKKDCGACINSWTKPCKSYPQGHSCGRLVKELKKLPRLYPIDVIKLMQELPNRCKRYNRKV